MFLFVLGLIVLVASIVAGTVGVKSLVTTRHNYNDDYEYGENQTERQKAREQEAEKRRKKFSALILSVGILFSVLMIASSFVVVLQPGEVGRSYNISGSGSELTVGYNFIPPWARRYNWDATVCVVTFSQGEADNDIYGAQTVEKDYIEAVATMGVRIDTERLDEWVKTYGAEQINSTKLQLMLKTVSRSAIEKSVGTYTTAEVMGNKNKIGEEAEKYFAEAILDVPIILDYFTLDDLIAPESYENAIKAQAELRMQKENAVLQQEINEQQAKADKAKAEGEANVKKTQAEADAAVKKIEAENAAAVAKIKADNDAEVKRIQAEAEANVRKIQAEAQANEITTQANAEAEATIAQGEAEAKAISAQGAAYKQNEQLIEIKLAEIQADVEAKWAEHWSGYSFEGMSGFNFTNLTDILKNLIPGANTRNVTE